MSNLKLSEENEVYLNLKNELRVKVSDWVESRFNYHHLEVIEKWCDNCLFEYIARPTAKNVFIDWLYDCEISIKIENYFDELEKENFEEFIQKYNDTEGGLLHCLKTCFQDEYEEFENWCIEFYEDDIEDYISEQENYPMWNTLFEFRDSFYNSEEDTEKCIKLGLGVIEGLEPFNNIIFMTSAGHSFYSAYWIPLYFEFYPDEKEKYKNINYSDL
jgi:hypothetical protein